MTVRMYSIQFMNVKLNKIEVLNKLKGGVFVGIDIKLYSNFDLWKMAEQQKVVSGDVFEDQEGNQIIYTGTSFQVYFTDADTDKQYVGLCVKDRWKFQGNESD